MAHTLVPGTFLVFLVPKPELFRVLFLVPTVSVGTSFSTLRVL